MMRLVLCRSVGVLAVAAAGLAALPASAEKGLQLAPASEWQYREFDDRCRASRDFGEGEDVTTLWIEQGGTETNYNLTVMGRPLRNPYGGGIYLQFGDYPEFIRSYIAAESSKGRPVLRMYGVGLTPPPPAARDEKSPAPDTALDLAKAGEIAALGLRGAIRQPVRLELGPMFEPLGTLALCGAKLSAILSEAGRPLSGEATPPVAIDSDTWLSAADYPDYLARAGMGGAVRIRITVNAEGKASSCFVTGSNKPQLFDDTVCLGVLKRARFEPARNARGEAVPSYFFYTITFFMK